jgi:hypothetical protein
VLTPEDLMSPVKTISLQTASNQFSSPPPASSSSSTPMHSDLHHTPSQSSSSSSASHQNTTFEPLSMSLLATPSGPIVVSAAEKNVFNMESSSSTAYSTSSSALVALPSSPIHTLNGSRKQLHFDEDEEDSDQQTKHESHLPRGPHNHHRTASAPATSALSSSSPTSVDAMLSTVTRLQSQLDRALADERSAQQAKRAAERVCCFQPTPVFAFSCVTFVMDVHVCLESDFWMMTRLVKICKINWTN